MRFAPNSLSVEKTERVLIVILVLVCLGWLISLWLLFTHQTVHIGLRRHSAVASIIMLCVYRISYNPSISLLVFFIDSRIHETCETYVVVLSIITFLLALLGCYFGDWAIYGYPNFPFIFGATYTRPNMFFRQIVAIPYFALSEISEHIHDSKAGHYVIIALIFITNVVMLFKTYRELNGITESYNVLRIVGFALSSYSSLAILVVYLVNAFPIHVLTSFSTICIPFAFICSQIVNQKLENLPKIIKKADATGNFDELEKMSVSQLVSAVGHSFSSIAGSWKVFNWMITKYPKNFEVHLVYVKFALFWNVDPKIIESVLIKMKMMRHISFYDKVTLAYIDLIYFWRGDLKKYSKTCTEALDDFIYHLGLFWTEVLLGREERLSSIAVSVSRKYENLRILMARNPDHIQKAHFNSLFSFKTCTFTQTYSNKSQNKFEQHIDSIGVSRRMDKFERQAFTCVSIEGFLRSNSRSIMRFQHLSFFIPLYFGACLMISLFIFMLVTNRKLDNIINLFRQTAHTIFPFAECHLAYSFIPVAEDAKFFNITSMSQYLGNSTIFESKLVHPRDDILDILSTFSSIVSNLSEAFSEFPHKNLINNTFHTDLKLEIDLSSGSQERNIYLIPYLYYFNSRLKSFASLPLDEILIYFNSTNVKLFNVNTLNVLHFLTSFYESEVVQVAELRKKESFTGFLIFEIVSLVVTLFVFVLIMMSFNKLINAHKNMFKPFFGLPKMFVTDLIDKYGMSDTSDLTTNSPEDTQIKYNMQQLAVEKPATSFLTIEEIKFKGTLFSIIITIIFRALLTPIDWAVYTESKNSMKILESSKISVSIPSCLFEIAHKILEIEANLFYHKVELEYQKILIQNLNKATTKLQQMMNDFTVNPPYEGRNMYVDEIYPDSKSPFLKYSILDRLSFVIPSIYQTISDANNNSINLEQAEVVMDCILSIIGVQVPNFLDESLSLATKSCEYIIDFAIIGFLVYISSFELILVIMKVLLNRIHATYDFAVPIFETIPAESIPYFKQVIETKATQQESQTLSKLGAFENEDTLNMLRDPLIFVDVDLRIVFTNIAAQNMFQFDARDKLGVEFSDFVDDLSPSRLDLILPPAHDDIFEFYALLPDCTQIMVRANIFPIKKFTYNEFRISFVCLMEDITKLSFVVNRLTQESNRLKLLTSQFLPVDLVNVALNDDPYQPILIPKALECSVFISQIDKFENELEILPLKEAIRTSLNMFPDLIFFGRSIQMFRVLIGVQNPNLAPEMASEMVAFALDLIDRVKKVRSSIGKDIDIRVGIHITDSQFADLVSSNPPVFDVYGTDSSLSSLVAMSCSPNQVNITRDVYEAVFDQGMNIVFEDEVTRMGGSVTSVYHVVRQAS